MNQELTPIFTSLLKKSFAEPEFTSLEDNQYGEFVKGFTDNFISSYKLDDADNKRYYESLAETTLGSYRKRNDIPRFVPTSEQSQELFERFPDLSLVDNIDDREKKVDEWRSRSFEKASAIRPAEREDIGVYLDALSNNFIRESASELNQTNWVGDKAYRFAEAFVRPVHELIDKPGAERAWAKTAPEDPNRDEDFTSMLASGFGQAGMQILTAATLTAAGQPELVPYVFGAMFGAQYMKDGYYNEMRRSGDEDKAWNNAVSQIPAAFLETIGDVALVRGVTKTARGYGKAFASATTEAEKRAILRKALPSMGKSAAEGFIAEFAVGGMGAEFASGFGSYLATGNEDYLRSFGEIFKSGLAEGIVGAVTSGAVHGFTAGNAQTRIAEDISVLTGFNDIKAKQEGINEALKRRDFNKVISLTNGQFVDPSQFDAHLEASDTLRGRATDENGEPIAKPKDKNDYSSRVPVSSPITSTAKNSLIAEATLNDSEISKLSALPSRTEEEEQKLSALTERNTYVKGVIESINNKTYENPTEVDLTFDDSNEAFYEGKESKEKPKREGVHEVVLENGETLNDDGAVVYFDKKFQQAFNTAVAHYGKENVSIKRNVNGNTANIYINKDGKWIKTNAESSYNVNPSKGAVPVSFVENEDSKSVKVKFHPTVKDSTKLPANFTIVEDTGDSVKVRHSDGRVFTFTGDRAIAAREMNAKREEVKQAKEDKKKKPDKTEKSKDSGKQLPSLLDDSEINQENPVSEEKFTQKKVNQNDPMSVLVDEELRSLSNSERKKLSPGRFERQSLSDVSDKGVDLWHEGKRGRVKKDATTGRFYFEAEDKTQIELNGNQESSLASVGITKGGKPGSPKEKVSLTTNKPSSEKKQSHKTLISSLKEKLDQIHHDSIDRLSSISGIINKLISLGIEYKVMSREEIAKEYGENNSPGFATSDGKIVFNLDALNATNKHDLLFKILAIHESAHAGIYIVAQQNPELYQAAKESVNNNPELIAIAREEYGKYDNGNYRFDSMNQDGIFHETIRMIIEGRLTGRTTGLANSGPLKAFLQKLIDYIRNIMWRTSDRIVFKFVKNVEDVIGVTNSAIKIENENITVNDIPSNIISDFVRIINGEDVDLENYKRDQLRDLADLMRIKRDRPDIKERLLSRIKEYKPISDSSNTNIINNSQPITNERVARHTELEEKFNNKTITPEETAEAQELVDEAVKAAGLKSAQVIHSTNADFDTFGRVRTTATAKGRVETVTPIKSTGAGLIYATENLSYSALFGDKQLKLYHAISNPADFRSLGTGVVSDSTFDELLTALGIAHKPSVSGMAHVFERLNKGQHKKAMIEAGFDGFTLLERSGDLEAEAIAGFDSSQFKSADPFTGVSLDKRFDSTNNNIQNSQPIIVGSDFFADSGKFYRVIQGDESLNDILQSGEVRTNAAEKIKSGMTLAEKMAARPTAFPSFSKGSASMSYAAENPNHSIIVTADKSLQPSTSGRHSAGKTHFPTVDGVHQKSLGNNFQVYKHIGNGEYELVFDKGMTGEIDNAPFSLAPRSQQDTEYLAAVEAGDSGSDNLIQLLRDAPESNRRVVVDAWLRRNPKAAANTQRMADEAAKAAGERKLYHVGQMERPALRQESVTGGVGEVYLTEQPTAWAAALEREGDPVSQWYLPDSTIAKTQPSRRELVDWAISRGFMEMKSVTKPDGTTVFELDDKTPLIRPEETLKGKSLPFYNTQDPMRGGNQQKHLIYAYLKERGFAAYEAEYSRDGHEIIVFAPSQIKSADPVTFDESGNVIPLSQRFDSTNNNIQNSQPINLGDKFSFRLANVIRNAEDTLLGLKIANDGTLPTQSLIAKISKSGINEFEVEELTNLVNSLGINGRVNISELSESIDNEPTLVVNTLDFGGTSNSKPYQIEIQNLTVKKNEIFHKIDTEFSGWTYDQYLSVFTSPDGKSMPLSQAIEAEPRGRSMPQKMQDYVNQAIEIQKQISSIQLDNEGVIDMSKSGSATGRFGVDPYSNEQLKGTQEIEPGHRLIWSGDLSLNIPSGENKIIRQRKVDNYEQINAFANEVKFTSQHYQGEVADNQLAFVRGGIHEYQKGNVLPDGTTATETTRIFEIWEVQSDWAASSDSIYKDGVYVGAFVDGVLTDSNINLKDYDENISDNISEPKDTKEGRASLIKNGYTIEKKSPLIKYWESLALKAALNHARKQGASNVIISDADTVMMTEGHDFERLAPNPVSMPDPISPGTYIVMDSGYIIPNSSFKTKKEADDFKDNYLRNYLPPRPSQEKGMRAAYDERIPNGFAKLTNSKGKKVTVGEHNKGPSNVFKNPDGTPKNTNTGRMYPVNNSVELQFSQPITNDSFLNEGIEEYKKLGWNYKKWGIIPQDLANKSVLEAVLNDPSLSESEKETIQSFAPGGEKFKTINALNSQPITNENITEEEVIDLASLSGESVSIVRKNQIKRINELRKRKIEAKLGPEEKSALSVLKGIKALAALPDESLEKYANLMEDFIDTRSRSDDAAIERIPIEEFLSKVHALDSEAKHAWFKQQQEDFPELQSKDFDKDFHGEMDQVKAAIDSIQENDQSIGLGRVNKNKEMYLEKIDALRDLIIDNIDEMKDNMLRRIDDVTFNKTDSQHLKAGTWLMQDTMDDLRQYFEDYLNSILTIDVSQSSAKDVRKAYYSLMGVAYDGYMLNANNFISSEIMSLLQNEASPLQVFKSKNTAENATKLMSISAQMRSTMDTKGYEILNRIAGKFRESIKKSHMFQQNALIPYQKESIEKAQKESGFNYSDTHLQKIGIYALSRRIRISEDPKSEIERNLKQLKDSVINLSRSADATLNAASEWYNNFIDGLFSGVLNSETPLQKLEENASIIGIDDGMKGYVNDIVGFFDHFKPIARFTTEFIYGREFKEEYNYIPSMILNLNPTSGPMQYDVDDLRFDMNSSDIAERNVNVSGLSGTYDRKAQLKQNQAMVFNINHLFSNRGRLNFLDSLSAVPRREIAALFRQDSEGSKAVKSFMHDEHGSKFRYHTLENAFRTMWKNEIESTQYLHEYQGLVNGILSRWAGVVLSSAYQGVGQLISNIAPFITVNIANPGKIMDMFSAFSYASKYRFGMLTDAQAHLYERLMFDLKNRHQDQVLDTSVNLGITKDSTWQAFKASAAAQGLSKVDKFVEKAKFFQFQEADFWSGAPMMMAEYLHQEKKRLGHDVKMEDLIYNEGSYFNAIDETERFIGIGNASRRGEWLTNRNVLITVLRHILTGFAGHRLNNASNAYIEMRKIATDGISVEEKTKSAAYVASIAVQSATFTAAKVFVISGIMSLVASILKDKDDDDEELKKLLDEASRANPADKKVIEAEISKRKEIRSTWENVQRRQDNSYLMTMNLTKDIASNIFIWPNLLEFAPDVLIYSTADAFEEKAFKDFKEKKMKELKTKMTNAKNLGDKVLANRFQLAIASLSSQQAVKVTMPNQGSLVPFNGMYGGAFRNIESVVKAMRDSYLGVDEFNINDFANLATVFGWSTADIQRFTRVAEDLDRANKNYQEKVNPTGKNK